MEPQTVEPMEIETKNSNQNGDPSSPDIKEDVTAVPPEPDTDDGEVQSVMKDVSEMDQMNDFSNHSPPPPRKIAKRSKGSSSSTRKSTSSPRLKIPTPTNIAGTPGGSSSEREPYSSPASFDNPGTNGSTNNDIDGDGEKSDKTESGDSHSIGSVTMNAISSNGTGNLLSPALTKRSVTLQMLLTAGILKPGDGTMSLDYHGQKFVGDLLENGQIRSQETSQEYSSPSGWAIACKQIINPEKIQRKSGCGWASIKYRGLKLDYYKTVWFKRLREGSIDVKNFSNGTSSTSEESDEDEIPYLILNYGEHMDSNPILQSAHQLGAKVMISCTNFLEIDRLQPFYVKVSRQALAMADFHCNITNTESLGYISGRWNNDENCLRMEVVHPCRVLMPNSSSLDCDNERNRIALEIQKMGHDVVGWYHSHPKAPPQPSKDDISRQLDYQLVMKGASESSYIPCVGAIFSPLCYTNQENLKCSPLQMFWVLPPPENRPTDIGRPMHMDYEAFSENNADYKKFLLDMGILVHYYRDRKDCVDMNDLTSGKIDKLKGSLTTWIPELKYNDPFWDEVQNLFTAPMTIPKMISVESSDTSTSSISATVLNSACASASTPNSTVSNATPPKVSTPTLAEDPLITPLINEQEKGS